MFGKVTQGESFYDLIAYILDESKNAKLIASQGVLTNSIADMARSFDLQAKLNPRLRLKVGHISLSFHENDSPKINDEFLVKIANEYLRKMNIHPNQWIIGRHFGSHPHIHVCYCRVDENGNTISDSHIHLRNMRITNELTRKYGLYYSKGKENVKIHRLREPQKTKHEIYYILKDEIPKCKSWEKLSEQLRKHGIDTTFKYKKGTNEIQGVVFQKGKFTFSGSKIDKYMSYNKISKTFGLEVNSMNAERNLNNNPQEIARENKMLRNSVVRGLSILEMDDNSDSERINNNDNKKKKKGFRR